MEESISEVYNMLEVIREHIISSGTRVPADKIFISRPKHTFVGEGPIILIYPEAPDRAMRRGDTNWWTSTYCWEFINIDVLVDDIYNDVSNSDAIRSQLEIKKELETMICSLAFLSHSSSRLIANGTDVPTIVPLGFSSW